MQQSIGIWMILHLAEALAELGSIELSTICNLQSALIKNKISDGKCHRECFKHLSVLMSLDTPPIIDIERETRRVVYCR